MSGQYSEEEIKKMRTFEAAMHLKDLKEGDVVTERHMKAIEFFLGDVLKVARSLQPTVATINFTKSGEPYTKDGNPLGITIDGKTPLDISGEGNGKS